MYSGRSAFTWESPSRFKMLPFFELFFFQVVFKKKRVFTHFAFTKTFRIREYVESRQFWMMKITIKYTYVSLFWFPARANRRPRSLAITPAFSSSSFCLTKLRVKVPLKFAVEVRHTFWSRSRRQEDRKSYFHHQKFNQPSFYHSNLVPSFQQ